MDSLTNDYSLFETKDNIKINAWIIFLPLIYKIDFHTEIQST